MSSFDTLYKSLLIFRGASPISPWCCTDGFGLEKLLLAKSIENIQIDVNCLFTNFRDSI